MLQYKGWRTHVLYLLITMIVMGICVAMGSVNIPLKEVLSILSQGIQGGETGAMGSIVLSVRFPRVLNVALVGAGLAISGGAMQGLLRNPLADGSTLGVSAGAALGAILSIAFGISFPFLSFGGTVVMAILFAFLSIVFILSLAHKVDYSLSTNTIILIGVIFSMFASSISSFIIVLASNKVESITFWQMGSLAGSTYKGAAFIAVILILSSLLILSKSRELDAFAIGERNAQHIGVDVRKTKLLIMLSISAIIGVCVAFSGMIGFVGLIIPHMVRKITGPNHRKLLTLCLYVGANFLLLADLLARTILRPLELPIGIVTSFVGSLLFIYIFYNMRKAE